MDNELLVQRFIWALYAAETKLTNKLDRELCSGRLSSTQDNSKNVPNLIALNAHTNHLSPPIYMMAWLNLVTKWN